MNLAPKKDKTIFIVGGCGGIGQAVVKGALTYGLKVALFDLKVSVEQNPPPKEVMVFIGDATIESDLAAAFAKCNDEWNGLDYLVSLVGFVGAFKNVSELLEEEWKETMEGNLKSTFLACKAAIPYLNKGGSIVNMSSGLGFAGRSNYAAYAASKAAVVSLTKTLAAELAPNIRVNALAPGAVNTAFLSGGTGRGGAKEKAATRVDLEAYKKIVPLREVAEPEDIAAPILFLLGEGAKHITGETLHINGGALMR